MLSPTELANRELARQEAELREAMEHEHCECMYFSRPRKDDEFAIYRNRIGCCLLDGEFYAPHRTAKQDNCENIELY